ncbi:MAG: thioredoxin domain-containing protein, partial [Proteobacteria bacterium]|nr:thioredoxin domain-containing protein [Pseudomonadota bacterium]
MKHSLLFGLLSLAAFGCENTDTTKLDNLKVAPAGQPSQQKKTPGTPAEAHNGSLEERVAALEARLDKSAEALNFLDMAYQQQKQAEEQKQREEPAPDAIFAIDIAGNLKANQFEGSIDAPVTIIDAFDFACPYCRKVNVTLEELVKEYDGKVRVVFKDMVVHPQVATDGHLASCAAA